MSQRRVGMRIRTFRDRVRAIKQVLGCQKCGECDPSCLDFHHVDTLNKSFGIARGVSEGLPWDEILHEIDKCDVLCANCHRKEHDV